jgi:hypothetical protein
MPDIVYTSGDQTISGIITFNSGIRTNIINPLSGGEISLSGSFGIYGTGNRAQVYFDSAYGRLGIGTGVPDAVLHVVAPCAKDGMIVESITNCPTGVTLLLVHNPQTTPVSGSYPAIITLAGRDNSYREIPYAQIRSRILDWKGGQTSGEIQFLVDNTGISKEIFVGNLSNIILGGDNKSSGSVQYSIVGQKNTATGVLFSLVGSNNTGVSIDNSISIGNNNRLTGPKIISISNDSLLNGSGLAVIGFSNAVTGNNNLLYGTNSYVTGINNIFLIDNTTLSTSDSFGLSKNSTIRGLSGIFIGSNSDSSGNHNIHIGNNTNLKGHNNAIFGSSVTSSGNENLIYGNFVNASGNSLISIGSMNDINNISNGVLISNDISLADTSNVILIGFDNATSDGLDNTVILGARNELSNGSLTDLLLIGQNNKTQDGSILLIIGNSNNASGILNNNIILGSGNSLINASNNNVIIGALNNQTGVYIDSYGSAVGNPVAYDAINTNTISIGTHNLSKYSNSNLFIGNKNTISGSNINVVGSYNKIINTDKSSVLGNSNYIESDNSVAIGQKTVVLGTNSIGINNSSQSSEIFGSGSIVVGNNSYVINGIVVGNSNSVYGQSGLVFGRNNKLGSKINNFTVPDLAQSRIRVNSHNLNYIVSDTALVQLRSPTNKNATFITTITNVVEYSNDGDYTLLDLSDVTFGSIPSGQPLAINSTFDENILGNNVYSGVIYPISRDSKIYGLDNIALGNSNSLLYNSGIIIGNNNVSSGIGSVIIGNNISIPNNNDYSVVIGPSNLHKLVIDNTKVVINSGTAQTALFVMNTAGNIMEHHDLTNSRVGINKTSPDSTLDINGLTTTSRIRLGSSTTADHVLTAGSDGEGTWQLPVKLSGTNNGILVKINNKAGSGINSIKYMPNNDGLNLYDNIFIIQDPTDNDFGFTINASKGTDAATMPFTIWGSGGAQAIRVMHADVTPENEKVNFYNIVSYSGTTEGFNITESLRGPVSLTGGILSIDNNGQFINRQIGPNSIAFNNNSASLSGNSKLRFNNNYNLLTIGTNGNIVSTQDDSSTDFDVQGLYNIVLSSTGVVDTVFNKKGYGNKFSIYQSGVGTYQGNSNRAFHVLPSGSVLINTSYNDYTIEIPAALYVNGSTYTRSLRLPSTLTSGNYLRIGADGLVEATAATVTANFAGTYPIRVTEDVGSYTVSLSTFRSNGTTLSSISDRGKVIAFTNAGSWNISEQLQLHGSGLSTTSLDAPVGINFGYQSKLNLTKHMHAFSAGSFLRPNPTNTYVPGVQGLSQYAQYYLRTRTINTSLKSLTTDWQTNFDSGPSPSNTICFRNTDLTNSNNGGFIGAYTYKIMISCVRYGDGGNWNAGGFICEGTIMSAGGTVYNVGTPFITGFLPANSPKLGNGSEAIGVRIVPTGYDGSNTHAIDIQVSGTGNMLWSATAQVNQLNWFANVDPNTNP